MSEISRKSGRRIVESIDTSKVSKQEVYDFYKRFRAQRKRAGETVEPLMKLKDVKKADIVRTLEKWEREPLERKAEAEYKKLQEQLKAVTPSEAASTYGEFQKKLDFWRKNRMIDISNVMGGTLAQPFVEIEKPAATTTDTAATAAAATTAAAPVVYQPITVTRYKGRFAHDLIAKWVDDGLIDNTDDYEDSEPIWEFMAETTQKAEDYQFFQDQYEGENAVGTNAYYQEFKKFLDDIQKFEAEMAKKKVTLPTYGTPRYLEMFDEWRDQKLAEESLL